MEGRALQPTAMRILDFYDRHPISESQVLDAVRRARGVSSPGEGLSSPGEGGADGTLTADDLYPFDQDHYGGLGAVDALARRAGITRASLVLDICAGLGGPARFLASRRGCRVVGVELHPGRAAGMQRLSRLVGVGRMVRVVRGDATALPFGAARFDACMSQEALLHVADKAAVLAEARRVLVPGGRLAFSDWIAHPGLGDLERARLEDWMAAVTLQSLDGYRALLGRAGFGGVEAEDLTDEWRAILRERLAMYRALREQTVRRLGEARYREYDALYAFFVGLVETGKLGGGRFSATR
jgi:SAM-dependent methyltransferase